MEIAAEDGHDDQGSAQSVGIQGQLAVLGEVGQRGDLGVVKDDVGREFGCVASEASESEQAPGDDGLDGEAAFQPLALVVVEELGPAAGLEDAMPLLDAPAQAILIQDPLGVLERGDALAGQQGPAERGRALGRGLLDGTEDGHGDRRGLAVRGVAGWRDPDGPVAQGPGGRPGGACGSGLLGTGGVAGGLTRDRQGHGPGGRFGGQRIEEPGLMRSHGSVNPGPDHQVDMAVPPLFSEQGEEVSLPIHDGHHAHALGGHMGGIAQTAQPAGRLASGGRSRTLGRPRGGIILDPGQTQRDAGVGIDGQGTVHVQAPGPGPAGIATDQTEVATLRVRGEVAVGAVLDQDHGSGSGQAPDGALAMRLQNVVGGHVRGRGLLDQPVVAGHPGRLPACGGGKGGGGVRGTTPRTRRQSRRNGRIQIVLTDRRGASGPAKRPRPAVSPTRSQPAAAKTVPA